VCRIGILGGVTVLRIALAQLDPTVGDLDGNLAKMVEAYERADAAGCDIVAFPELSTTGYPPEDLVLKPGFVADNLAVLAKLAARTRRCAAVVGFVDQDRDLYNAAAVCADGEVLGTYHKRLLPNSTVFDEARYFTPGHGSDPLELFVIGGVKVGVSICEDIWSPFGPVAEQAAAGAEINININASPFHTAKIDERERMLATRATDAHCAVVYVNQVGGQDELVFDGGSVVLDHEGTLLGRAPQFVEDLLIVDVPADEAAEMRAELARHDLHQIFLVAPTTTDARLRRAAELAGGFLYYVSIKGVTGASTLDTDSLAPAVERVRRAAGVPIAVGFGIRTPEHAAAAAESADAVVIGSALVERLGRADSAAAAVEAARDYLAPIRRAMDNTASSTNDVVSA